MRLYLLKMIIESEQWLIQIEQRRKLNHAQDRVNELEGYLEAFVNLEDIFSDILDRDKRKENEAFLTEEFLKGSKKIIFGLMLELGLV